MAQDQRDYHEYDPRRVLVRLPMVRGLPITDHERAHLQAVVTTMCQRMIHVFQSGNAGQSL